MGKDGGLRRNGWKLGCRNTDGTSVKVGVGDIVGIVVGLVRVGLRLRGTGNLLGWHEMGSLERKLVGCLAMIEESIVDSSVGRTEGDFVGRTPTL